MSAEMETLRSDALAMESKLIRWSENCKSEAAYVLAGDAAGLVREMREALERNLAAHTRGEQAGRERWQEMATCPSWAPGLQVVVVGGRYTRPTREPADGGWWRQMLVEGMDGPTHWLPDPLASLPPIPLVAIKPQAPGGEWVSCATTTQCNGETEAGCTQPWSDTDGVPYCDTCGLYRNSVHRREQELARHRSKRP